MYNDLTYYTHTHFENALNIGWCVGNTSKDDRGDRSELARKLIPYLDYTVNTIEGNARTVDFDGQSYLVGFREIRVIGADGIVYAAPDRILDDILQGRYTPPNCFVDALEEGFAPSSEVYQRYLERYNFETLWGRHDDEIRTVRHLTELIREGKVESLRMLTEAQRLIVTEYGSLVNTAIEISDEECVLKLVELGFPIHLHSGVELLSAIRKGYNIASLCLLKKGVPVFSKTVQQNPLFMAIAYGNNEIAKYLLKEKPDLAKEYSNAFLNKCDIMRWAAKNNNQEFISYIRNLSW